MTTGSTSLRRDGVYFDTGKGATGSINFSSSGISVNSSLGISGPGRFKSSLTVDGTGYFNSGLSVVGQGQFKTGLTVDGPGQFMSNLNVEGAGQFNSGISVAGPGQIDSGLTVGGPGQFNSGISVVGKGQFDSVISNTGTFQYMVGSTGYFTTFGAGSLTGSKGYFNYLASDTLTGSTGNFKSFGVGVLTGSTGYIGYLTTDNLTGGTGYFRNIITSKIGNNAGSTLQGTNAIAIGNNAGQFIQGKNSIAIGSYAGPSGMTSNSIALNASGTGLMATGSTGGFYASPIAPQTNSIGNLFFLAYGDDQQIVKVDALNIPQIQTTINPPTSTDIDFTVSYPQQVLVDKYYPIINSFSILLNGNEIFKDTNPNSSFFKNTFSSSLITTFHITNTLSGNTPNSFNITNSIIYVDNTINLVRLVYANSTKTINVDVPVTFASKELKNFNTTFTTDPLPLTLKFSATDGSGSKTASINYEIDYKPSSNTVRFGGPYDTSNIQILRSYTTDVTGTYQITGLYPDTQYDIQMKASNNQNSFTGSFPFTYTEGPFSPTGFFSTGGSTLPIYFSSNSVNVRQISDPTNIKTIGLTDSSNITSNLINIPIENTLYTRGLSGIGDPLVTISATIGTTGTTPYTFAGFTSNEYTKKASYNYNGKDYNLTSTKVDAYTGPKSGFYQYAQTNLEIPLDISDSTQIIIKATYPSTNIGPTGCLDTTVNYKTSITTDTPYFNPVIKSSNFTITSIDAPTQLCSLTVYNPKNIDIKSSIMVQNIGNYYFNYSSIIDYTMTGFNKISETDLKNATGLTGPSGQLTKFQYNETNGNTGTQFNNNLHFTSSDISYSNSVNIVATVYNVRNQTTSISQPFPYIFDPSLPLITTIPNIYYTTDPTNSGTIGCRLQTFTTGNEMSANPNIENILSPTLESYSKYIFDNSKSLLTDYTSDLLFANNMYVTPGIDTPEKYYIDYIAYDNANFSQNPNYSSIVATGYRYTTFAWSVSSIDTFYITNIGNNSPTQIKFTIKTNMGTNLKKNSDNSLSFNNTSKPLLYYRFEDTTKLTSLGPGNTKKTISQPLSGGYNSLVDIIDYYNNGTTNWIDANLSTNSQISFTSIDNVDYTNTSILNGLASTEITSTYVSFIVNIPFQSFSYNNNGKNFYIYCRFGVPLNVPFSFNSISAQLIN